MFWGGCASDRTAPGRHTPSLRARRSNPESLRGKTPDCYATLAMTRKDPRAQAAPVPWMRPPARG
ncbi:hypothetical protein EAS56_07955 [Bradyrhizobium guangzhouense]|uniref:Uncharacterized protein n=1 Tax=Bradyrhizobium guangzhouense TaxID=1325095 RepID=A0AAE5X5R2_9BRAD|nr:hypothetical protein XH91_30385 [Bradyrhizobium guangzhouense]RXH15942.1 hypothetical protein EAS56_07955 [Bradyrhizobium guangzhouense]